MTCVERDRSKFPTLLKNVAICERRIECKAQPVELFLARNKQSFDIVFLDPPFPYAYKQELLKAVDSGANVVERGLVLIHFPREDRLPERVGSLSVEDERSYGRSIVRFYRRQGA